MGWICFCFLFCSEEMWDRNGRITDVCREDLRPNSTPYKRSKECFSGNKNKSIYHYVSEVINIRERVAPNL